MANPRQSTQQYFDWSEIVWVLPATSQNATSKNVNVLVLPKRQMGQMEVEMLQNVAIMRRGPVENVDTSYMITCFPHLG